MTDAVRVCEDECSSCKLCIYTCPEPNVIQIKENGKVMIDGMRCKGCFLCVSICPRGALSKCNEK